MTAVSISPLPFYMKSRKLCKHEKDPPWFISISDMTCKQNERSREFSPITCKLKWWRNMPETFTMGITWDRMSWLYKVFDGTRVVNIILSFWLNIPSMTLVFQYSGAGLILHDVSMSAGLNGIWLGCRNVVLWGKKSFERQFASDHSRLFRRMPSREAHQYL